MVRRGPRALGWVFGKRLAEQSYQINEGPYDQRGPRFRVSPMSKNQKPQDQGRRTYDLAAFGVRALLTINWQIMLRLGFVSIRKRY